MKFLKVLIIDNKPKHDKVIQKTCLQLRQQGKLEDWTFYRYNKTSPSLASKKFEHQVGLQDWIQYEPSCFQVSFLSPQ